MTITIDEKDFGARFRQEQREREEFLRNTRTATTVTEQIEKAIGRGNARDALNATLAQRDAALSLLKIEEGRSAMLLDALETIRAMTWKHCLPPSTPLLKTIDEIARKILRASGQIPMNTTEED